MSIIPFPVCEYAAIHYKDGRRLEYQPSGAEGTCSQPATPVKSKMAARGAPKWLTWSGKKIMVKIAVHYRRCQLTT